MHEAEVGLHINQRMQDRATIIGAFRAAFFEHLNSKKLHSL